MLRKWKEKERWTGRRRSEPYGGGEEEEEEEERKTDRRDRQIHRQMLRRTSEPCGQTEAEEETEEDEKTDLKKERRKSETNMDEEDKKEKRRTEVGRGKERKKSTSWITVEDRGQVDRKTLRRRSEPCGVLYVQLLPLSSRKRRELLHRRTGRRTSYSEDGDRQMDRRPMSGGTSGPISSLENSKLKDPMTVELGAHHSNHSVTIATASDTTPASHVFHLRLPSNHLLTAAKTPGNTLTVYQHPSNH